VHVISHHFGEEWLSKGQAPACIKTRGGTTWTSGIPGIDFATGRVSADPADQMRAAFDNCALLLREAGCPLNSVALIDVTISSRELRSHIDGPWLDLFPDSTNRPARKTNQRLLPEGVFAQVQAICIEGERQSVEIEGLRHRAPIPMGACAGPYVFSSVIGGEDPASGDLPTDPTDQIEQAFTNCARLMRAAGGDETGINHMWVFIADYGLSDAVLDAYLRMFPDDSKPARKILPYALPEGCVIQIQMSGSIEGRTANYEVPLFAHHDPIPLASRAGQLFQSSGIHGQVPGTLSPDPGGALRQTELSLETVGRLMERAGGQLDDITGLTVLVDNLSDAAPIYGTIGERLGRSAPPVNFAQAALPPDMLMQFHVTGWLPE